jgi:hypothetical protein
MMAAAKTMDDLPHFRVSSMKPVESSEFAFELLGAFDRTSDVREGHCTLLVPGQNVLTASGGNLTIQDPAAGTALFQTSDESMPDVVGLDLTYVDDKWEPVHVWMVTVPTWRWTRTLFQAMDAIGRVVAGDGVTVLDGEEVTEWIQIKPAGKDSNLSRYYPVFPSGKPVLPPIGPDGVIIGGWTHAHCELCDAHVDAGMYGYLDSGEHWVCESCYARYVVNHDLSFMQL